MSSKPNRKKQQLNNDEINFDQQLIQLKKIVFKLFAFYNKRIAALPPFVIYLLTFIQFLQTLFFIVNPELGMYAVDGPVVQTFGSILSYLTAYALVKKNSGLINFFLLLSIFFWLLFSLFLVYFSYLKIAKSNTLDIDKNNKRGISNNQKSIETSKLQTLLINLCIGNLLLLNSVLIVPYFFIIFPVFYCTQHTFVSYTIIGGKQCYDFSHIISMIIGLFSILIVLGLKFLCILLMFERNPLKNSLYACHSNISILIKTAAHILGVWYLIIDPLLKFKPLYIGGLVIMFGQYLLIFRWQQMGFYNKSYMNFILCLEILYFCFSGNNIIKYFFEGGTKLGISFIQFLLASCIMAYSTMSVVNVTNKKMIKEFYCTPEAMKKGQHAQNLVIQLIYHLISESDKQVRSTNIRVILKQLDRSPGSKLEQEEPQFVHLVSAYLQKKQAFTQKAQKMIVFQYFRILLQELIFIKSCFMFEALRCSFLFEYGLKTKALCQIYKIEAGKLDWMEDFFLYQIKQRSSNSFSDPGEDTSQAFEQIDEERIIIYDQYISLMSVLEQAIVESIMVNKEFWSQILQEHPDFQYARRLTERLRQNHSQILKINLKIRSIFDNSLKQKFLYYSYLELLEWSREHTEEMIEFLQQNQEHLMEKQNKKIVIENFDTENYTVAFEENQKIVMIELDFGNFEGIIKDCNSEIYNFLGYTRNELIGRKIDKLLPGPIAQRHSKFIQNFINRRDSISKSSERVLYAVHKEKFIVPGFLTIKVIFSEEKGLKLVSFIRPLSQEHRTFGLMTISEDTIILGVTRQIMLKIKDQEFIQDIKNQSVYLELLFPKLKVEEMQPNKFYESQMAIMNSIEQEHQGESKTKVLIKYQEMHYQEDLHLKYYEVRLLNKSGRQVTGTLAMLDKSFRELPGTHVTTSRMIESFQGKKQQQRKAKMQQLNRFKQNYLNKYNSSKYYMCLIVFVLMVSVCIWQSVHMFGEGKEFGESVELNRLKLENLNFLAKDLSQLESQWIGLEFSHDFNLLESYKSAYASIVDRYNLNLGMFRANTVSSDVPSLFNINVLPSKLKRYNSLVTVQTNSQQFSQIQPLSSRNDSDSIIYQIQRNAILINTRQLLQFYIDQQLTMNDSISSLFNQKTQLKFIFGICSVVALAGFSISLFFVASKIKFPLDKNLQIINFLTYSQIYTVVTSFTDYLKMYLSSQLDSIDQFDTIQKMVTQVRVPGQTLTTVKTHDNGRLSNRLKLNKKNSSNSEGNQLFHDENSLHIEGLVEQTKIFGKINEQVHPLEMNEIQKDHQNQKYNEKSKNGGSPMKTSLKKGRKSESTNNFTRKFDRGSNSMMQQHVVQKPNLTSRKDFLKIDSKDDGKKKISFVKDSEFTGLQLSAEALEKQRYDNNQYSRTQIMNKDYIAQNFELGLIPTRKTRQKLRTLNTTPVHLPYPTNLKVISVCMVLVMIYGGYSYMIYQMQKEQESVLVNMEHSINNLIKISGKLMFLRSFIRPYFCEMKDENGTIIIVKESLSNEIKILQSYTTVSFPELQDTELILKDIYRDITLYIYLLQTYSPDTKYFQTSDSIPPELSESIKRIEQNFLSRHQQIYDSISQIDTQSKQHEKQLRIKYMAQMVGDIILFIVVLGVEYYLVIWKLKTDQKATYTMIEFFPLRLISGNKSVHKAIKKESSNLQV